MTVHVLIVCTHNSARSILAEAMLNHWAKSLGKDVHAHSAGSSPSGRINPLAIEVLSEAGVETHGLRSKSWDEFVAIGSPSISIVITVCDSAAAEACPVFIDPTGHRPIKVHWGYPDPSRAEGDDLDRRQAFELTRQSISHRMQRLLDLPLHAMDRHALETALSEIGLT